MFSVSRLHHASYFAGPWSWWVYDATRLCEAPDLQESTFARFNRIGKAHLLLAEMSEPGWWPDQNPLDKNPLFRDGDLLQVQLGPTGTALRTVRVHLDGRVWLERLL